VTSRAPHPVPPLRVPLRLLLGAILAGAALAGPARAMPPLPGHGRIGVEIRTLTPELRRHLGAPTDRGLLVARVEPGGPAGRAGVRVGDVLLAAGGEPLEATYDLVRVVGRTPAGEPLTLRLLRDGETLALEVRPEGAALPWPDPGAWSEWLERGFEMGSRELRDRLRELERRLEELERRMDEERPLPEDAERT